MDKYCLNSSLIAREGERSFFDKKSFRILRFNHSGFAILRRKLGMHFTLADFSQACEQEGISANDRDAFWKKCVDHRVIVHYPSEAAPGNA